MRVTNATGYNSREVKAILTRVYREHVEHESKIPALTVELRMTRDSDLSRGRAWKYGKHIVLWLAQPITYPIIMNLVMSGVMSHMGKRSLAHVFAHELLHLVGYSHGCADWRMHSTYEKGSVVLDDYDWVKEYVVTWHDNTVVVSRIG